MIILFKLIILTSMIVVALKIAMSDGMLLDKLGNYFENKVNEGHKIYDLFICPFCMNTLQVFTAHAFAFGLGIIPFEFNWQLILRVPLIIFGASFLSGTIWNLHEAVNRSKEKNEQEAEYFRIKQEVELLKQKEYETVNN